MYKRAAHAWAAPLGGLVWQLFIVFTAVGFYVMPSGIGAAEIKEWVKVPGLREALLLFLGYADALWMFLAAVNIYFYMIEREGLAVARRWALLIIVGSGLLEWVGTRTGYPFGPYIYTSNFGPLIGGVLPCTIPLAWVVVVMASRYTVLALFPALNRWLLSLGVGLLALVTDLNMELVAWKVRAYWIWYPHDPAPPLWPPWQNFLSWFMAAYVLNALLDGGRVAGIAKSAHKPVVVLLLMNAMFIAVHLVRWWRL